MPKITAIDTIKKEVSPVVKEAQKLSISSQKDMTVAAEMLSRLNKYNDALIEDKEKLTVPLNTTLKEIRSRYKPTEVVLEESISLIRAKIGSYQTEQTALAKKEEAKIAAKVSSGKLSIDKAVAKMDAIETPLAKVSADSGSIKFRTDKVLKITDKSLIPHEYYDLNEKRVLDALKAGFTVPGAEIEEVQNVINSR